MTEPITADCVEAMREGGREVTGPITWDSPDDGYEMPGGNHHPRRVLIVGEEGRPLLPSQRYATMADVVRACEATDEKEVSP